ncbi:hypothetical protein GCM10010965_20190 [Caldalkalibacillus thermarum]|uniref:CHASE3 domain-containing protein n=1 Tax=Caldalkalibacillus thermarum TaxID=296745 RepID=UPI001668A904|nr:CHASE3 domain-containing protein [Caldalkalibacillus thermarum]GGK27334.1 hypothetical protein GCM10010965_20190 [Caldalkalibacillus thermarum]
MFQSIKAKLYFSFSIAIVVMILLAVSAFYFLNRTQAEIEQILDHDFHLITNALTLEKLLVDIETGERGYLLTGNESYLEPYENAAQTIDHIFERLQADVSDHPEQMKQLEQINHLVQVWLEWAVRPHIEARQGRSLEQALNRINLDSGRQYMDQIRQELAAFIQTKVAI